MTRPKYESRRDDSGKVELSVPLLLVLFVFFLLIGGGLTFLAINFTQPEPEPAAEAPVETLTPTVTQAEEPSATAEASPTITHTQLPTFTPFSYVVKAGDTCDLLALVFEVSITDLVLLNELPASCPLQIDQALTIPHPTFTPTPEVTATPNVKTVTACEVEVVFVQEEETIGLLSELTGVPVQELLDWNGKSSTLLFVGERLEIPLCRISEIAGVGTVTPSPAPPYSPAQLLSPRDGEYFAAAQNEIILQWASVGALRNNEYYRVTITDVTAGGTIVLRAEVQENSLILPATLQPVGSSSHLFMWTVQPFAVIGGDAENPVYRESGPESDPRYFVWEGAN